MQTARALSLGAVRELEVHAHGLEDWQQIGEHDRRIDAALEIAAAADYSEGFHSQPRTLPMRLMRRTLLALACGAALVSSAQGVVISTGDGSGNTNSPGSNTGWANVGRVSSASGVYLGNRWVITANHVSTAPLRLSDGRTFAVSVGSDVRLRNAAGGFVDSAPPPRRQSSSRDRPVAAKKSGAAKA